MIYGTYEKPYVKRIANLTGDQARIALRCLIEDGYVAGPLIYEVLNTAEGTGKQTHAYAVELATLRSAGDSIHRPNSFGRFR